MRFFRMVTNKAFAQIFLALLCIIIVMFVSNYMVYQNSVSQIYGQVKENNRLAFDKVITSFDDTFREINNTIHSIQMLPPNDLIDSTSDGQPDMLKVYTLQKNLATLVSHLDYMEDVVVFFAHSKLAVTSFGTMDFKEMFTKKYRSVNYGVDFWRTYSATTHPQVYFPAESYLITDSNRQLRKELIVSLGSNKIRFSQKNVMMLIDVEKLLEHVNQKVLMKGTSLIVLDSNRNVLLSTEKNLDLMEVLNDIYFNVGQEVTDKNKEFEYQSFQSEYNSFIYIQKLPYKFNSMHSISKANWIIMLTAIASSVILSLLLSIQLYRPVRNVLRRLGVGGGRGQDYRKILSEINEIQQANEKYKQQLATIDLEMQRNVFLNTLEEYPQYGELEMRMHQYFSDFFKKKWFVMAEIQLLPRMDSAQLASLRLDQLHEALKAGLQQRLEQVTVFYISSLNYLVLIGLEKPMEREAILRELNEYTDDLNDERFKNISLLCSLSRTYAAKLTNCRPAYQDLMHCRMYRSMDVEHRVIDIQDIRYNWDIYYPLDELVRLSNSLMGGNADDSMRIVQEIIEKNVAQGIHQHQLVRMAESLFYHMLRHLELDKLEQKEILTMESGFRKSMMEALNYREILQEIVKWARSIAEQNQQLQRGKLHPGYISQYIELHYMDNLYLDHMAETFGTTPKYFSNYFKKTFGVNYVEYLNKVRLTQARELLKRTDLSIAEIGERTGYLNSTTFASTFKKYYGISPSKYRENELK